MRKLLAIFFSLILVFPLLLASQSTISVTSWALDRQFYIDALNDPGVYQTLTSGPMIDKLLREQMRLPFEADTSELESILMSILTPDYMRVQVNGIVNDIFDYMQGKSDDFKPTLDIAPLKTALGGSQQDAFLTALVDALPTCELGQIPGFGSADQNACKPTGVSDEMLVEQVLKPALPVTLSSVPDEIPLQGEWLSRFENARWRTFVPGMAVPAGIILSIMVLVFFSLCLWYMTALVADSDWRGRLQWLGWMLLIPSVLVFLLGFASQSGIPAYWIRFGLERANLDFTTFGPVLAETLQIVSISALPRVASAFQMVGGFCGAVSIALIFWGIATPKKKPEDI